MSEPVPISQLVKQFKPPKPKPPKRPTGTELEIARDEIETTLDALEEAREKAKTELAARGALRALARDLGLEQLRMMEREAGVVFNSDMLVKICRFAAMEMGLRVIGGEFVVKDAGQAVRAMEGLVQMARLESGQATSIEGHLSAEDLVKELAKMKARAQANIAAKAAINAEVVE